MRRDKTRTPDYDILARAYLGRGLSKLPEAAKHANVAEIEDMPILALMRLAKKMGVDANAVIEETEAQENRLRRYSDSNPGFKGVFEFDLTVEVCGKRVTRKAKAEYEFTPEWEYYDLHKQAPFEGWGGASMGVKVLSAPEEDGRLGEPEWEEIDILKIDAVWDILDLAIEERCKVEDAERRRVAEAQKSVPAPKPFSKRRH